MARVRCGNCYNAIDAAEAVCPHCGQSRSASGASATPRSAPGSAPRSGSRPAPRPGSGQARPPVARATPQPAVPQPIVPAAAGSTAAPRPGGTLSGRVVGDPVPHDDERQRPALTALVRLAPVLVLLYLLYLVYRTLSDPLASAALTQSLVLLAVPVLLLGWILHRLGMGSVSGLLLRAPFAVFRAASGAAASGRAARSERGGPTQVPSLAFRLRDPSGQEHVCQADGVVGVPHLANGDDVVMTGRLDHRDGVFLVREVRGAHGGAVLLRARPPLGVLAEWAARAAWLVLALSVLLAIVG